MTDTTLNSRENF